MVAVVAAAILPPPTCATTANDLCSASADPCRVTTTVSVTPGSMIDVGSRTLQIANHGILDLISGTMTLNAGTLTVDIGGLLRARGTGATAGGQIIGTAGVIAINGGIDASGAPGGDVNLTSTATLMLNGSLDVHSRSPSDGGGTVELKGTDITIGAGGSINSVGGSNDFGGSIDFEASGALTIGGGVDVTGGDGGDITADAGGALSIAASVTLDADATLAGESGGNIDLTAIGPVTVDGTLSATGRSGTPDTGGGDGGEICVEGSAISVAHGTTLMAASGGGPDGTGGDVALISDAGDIDYAGQITAAGTGLDGSGGTITIDAAGALTLSGSLDGTGGTGDGGEVDLTSQGDLSLTAAATVSVVASGTGSGGDIGLDGGNTVDVAGDLSSDGGPGGGGGTIGVTACTVQVDDTATLSNLRNGGINTLLGRDLTIVAGTLKADPGTGRNTILFAGPDYEPFIRFSAHIDPPPSLVQDSTIVPCNPVVTPTPTRTNPVGGTPTPTRTNPVGGTPTVTPTTIACVGDCGGTGSVSIADLITGVNIALGIQPIGNCPAFDANGDGTVTINELIQAVTNALNGCP